MKAGEVSQVITLRLTDIYKDIYKYSTIKGILGYGPF